MNRIPFIVCIALSSLAGICLHAQTAPQKEELVVPLSTPGKPYTLDVTLMSGSIEASSYSGKEIVIDVSPGDNRGDREHRKMKTDLRRQDGTTLSIDANIYSDPDGPVSKRRTTPSGDTADGGRRINLKLKSRDSDSVDGMHRINPKFGYEITATERDNNVMIQNGTTKNVHLSLKVPQNVKLKLRTFNDGHIEVADIVGELEISSVNGSLKLTNISGSAVANTVNGKIIANFLLVDPKAPMAFSTLNGNIDVTLPANVKSNLKLRSDRGDIFTDFDMAIEKNQPQLDHPSGTSMYSIKLADWINGKINGGGPEIMMKNMIGNIYVRKAK
jgi:hypothetical protein